MKRFIVLLVLLPVLLAGQYAREYAISKDAGRFVLAWAPITEEPVEYRVSMWSYAWAATAPWSTFGVSEPSKEFQISVTGDSCLFFIQAIDMAGNIGEPSDTVKAAFRSAAPEPEDPPVTGPFDAPLAQDFRESTAGWSIRGPGGIYNRAYDYGLGLYFFENLGPYPQYDCYITRTLRLQAGRYTVTLWAGSTKDCSLVTTLGTSTSVATIQAKKNYADTLGNEIEMNFQVTQTGNHVLKFDPLSDACFKRWQIVLAGGEADVTPPPRIRLLRVEE